MPCNYAHKKMGSKVYKSLPKDTRLLIQKYLPYFLIGLHGPDVLFFYRPGLSNHIADYGRKLHHTHFEEFYDNAKLQMEVSGDDEKLVYFYGVLCHLYLDALCHPYVQKAKEEFGVTHGKLEMEYDRYLLEKDGHKAMSYPILAHVGISREYAHHIAPFYMGISEDEYLEALIEFKAVTTVTRLRDPITRKAICMVMNATGNEHKVASILMSKQKSELCKPAMKRLDSLMEDAALLAREAIEGFSKYLFQENKGKPEYTDFDFYGE